METPQADVPGEISADRQHRPPALGGKVPQMIPASSPWAVPLMPSEAEKSVPHQNMAWMADPRAKEMVSLFQQLSFGVF